MTESRQNYDAISIIRVGVYNDAGPPATSALQCAQALPLFLGLVPSNVSQLCIDALLANLATYDGHLQVWHIHCDAG